MANTNLGAAKAAKNDEFYTQYHDIEREVNAYIEYDPDVFRGKTILLPCDDPEWSNFTKYFAQNFDRFGLKRLISTSYAPESKKFINWEPTLFETEDPKFDEDKSKTNGKIFILDRDKTGDGRIDVNDLVWDYLEGDGDFRSDEIKRLRDEADFIITNPPFSLFREFLAWIVEADKRFLVIGNMNAITYKEVFPLIKDNRIWLGTNDVRWFYFEKASGDLYEAAHSRWFTNIDNGRRHQPLPLMTMADNIKFSRHKEIRGHGYQHYDNYDAIEVPYTDAIPSDYEECLGVPISFLDKYCPEQFEIIGSFNNSNLAEKGNEGYVLSKDTPTIIGGVEKMWNGPVVNKQPLYKRIVIKAITPPLNTMSINELRDYVIRTFGFVPEEVTIVSGIMGVPISFLDKYCPEQFEILGMCENMDLYGLKTRVYTTDECRKAYYDKFGKKGTYDLNASGVVIENNLYEKVYQRILIRKM